MTEAKLDEIIKRYTDNAEYVRQRGDLEGCMEFRELAKFLTECKKLFITCEDCVSREAVLDALHAFGRPTKKFDYILAVQQDIKALPPVTPKQKWIPVSERLPEESLNCVLGWDDNRERCVFVQYVNGRFQFLGRDSSFKITAWMPLPEPYKAESEVMA